MGNGTNDINNVREEGSNHGQALVSESDSESYNIDVDAWHAYNLAVGGIPIPSSPTATAPNTNDHDLDKVYKCGLCGLVFPDLKAVCWHASTHPYRPYGDGIAPPHPPPRYFLIRPAVGGNEAVEEMELTENENATTVIGDHDAAPSEIESGKDE